MGIYAFEHCDTALHGRLQSSNTNISMLVFSIRVLQKDVCSSTNNTT